MRITVLETLSSRKSRFVVVYAMASWPERSLQHRGWLNARLVYDRPATPYERQEAAESTRYLAFRYPDWAALAADEAKYGIDADACRQGSICTEQGGPSHG